MNEAQILRADQTDLCHQPGERSEFVGRLPDWIYDSFCMSLAIAYLSKAPGHGHAEMPDDTTLHYMRPTAWCGYRAFSRTQGMFCLNYERVFDDQLPPPPEEPDEAPPEADVSDMDIVETTEHVLGLIQEVKHEDA